jgi:glyoxylase-like metal-dependent hydrolase (beta-lactamase superfamily II)
MIRVKKFVVNPLQENSYLLYDDTGCCLIVDAGFYYQEEKEELLIFIHENRLTPVSLINTHCHFDHVLGVEYLRKKLKIPFACHKEERFWLQRASQQSLMFGIEMENISEADCFVSEGEKVRFGDSEVEILHIPGHSPGHIVLYSPKEQFLIAGDVLFAGSIGRSDLPGGNYLNLIRNIKEKLMILPGETLVYSGHGPDSSIGNEKINNPFLNEAGM